MQTFCIWKFWNNLLMTFIYWFIFWCLFLWFWRYMCWSNLQLTENIEVHRCVDEQSDVWKQSDGEYLFSYVNVWWWPCGFSLLVLQINVGQYFGRCLSNLTSFAGDILKEIHFLTAGIQMVVLWGADPSCAPHGWICFRAVNRSVMGVINAALI